MTSSKDFLRIGRTGSKKVCLTFLRSKNTRMFFLSFNLQRLLSPVQGILQVVICFRRFGVRKTGPMSIFFGKISPKIATADIFLE